MLRPHLARLRVPAVVGACLLGATALAQDDPFGDEDEFVFDDEPTGEDPEADSDSPPAESEPEPEPEVFDFEDAVDEESGERVEEDDLFEGEQSATEQVEGADTPAIYRAAKVEYGALPGDEEVMAWEGYLAEYPNSLFRGAIEERTETLLSQAFSETMERVDGDREDAASAELVTTQALHLANLNPRSRIYVGFEYGFPSHTGGVVDFEYALLRQVSVHAGFTGRYSGWGLELGSRYAFVKSARDQVIGTVMLDLRANFSRALNFQVRPAVGFHKVFNADKYGGRVNLQALVGTEIGVRANETVGLFGGARVDVRIAEPVGAFLESDFTTRHLGREGSPLAFASVGFGLTFYPFGNRKDDTADDLELGVGGHFPAASRYLQPFLGGVQAQAVYQLSKLPYVK